MNLAGPLGRVVLGRRAAAVGFDVDTLAYFAAMTFQPDAARQSLINDLIVGLKADGLWSKLDLFYLMASHTQQASFINVKNPSAYTASLVPDPSFPGYPTFTTDRGWGVSGGTVAYLATGYLLNTVGNHTSSSVHSMISFNYGGGSSVESPMGTTTDTYHMKAYAGLTTYTGKMGTSGPTTAFGANDKNYGVFSMGRRAASPTTLVGLRNGVLIGSGTTSSPAFGATEVRLTSANIGGVQTGYGGRIRAYMFGGELSDAQDAAQYTRLITYLNAIGATELAL